MSRFITMVKRELRAVTREKTIMLAIVIQLFIASFSSVIVTGLMSFYDPDSIGQTARASFRIGLVDETGGPLAAILAEKSLSVLPMRTAGAAERAFSRGYIDAAILLPEPADGATTNMRLVLPELDSKATVLTMVLKEPLKEYEDYLRRQNGITPGYTGLEARADTTFEFHYSLILPILMFFPALLAGSLVIDTISEETENKTLDTLRAAPVSLGQILGAKVTAAVIMVLLQCSAWLGLLHANNLPVANAGTVLLLALVVGTLVSLGAALVALYFKDRERAQFTYSMALVGLVGLSYLLEPSPFNLIARLATGDATAAPTALLYLLPLLPVALAFSRYSGRLLAARSAR